MLSDAAPPAGHEKLRELAVTSGKGCGMLGQPGRAEGARAEMRRAAASWAPPTCSSPKRKSHLSTTNASSTLTSSAASPTASWSRRWPRQRSVRPGRHAQTSQPRGSIVQDYEGVETATKPAAATARSKVTLTVAPGDRSRSALSVDYSCSGDEQRADLDVWGTPLVSDWTAGNALTLRIKPDATMSLSVSFVDGNDAGYTQKTEPLAAGQWQIVRLPFEKFWFNPFGPPGDVKALRSIAATSRPSASPPKGAPTGTS